jgi:hypothetical protein
LPDWPYKPAADIVDKPAADIVDLEEKLQKTRHTSLSKAKNDQMKLEIVRIRFEFGVSDERVERERERRSKLRWAAKPEPKVNTGGMAELAEEALRKSKEKHRLSEMDSDRKQQNP